MITPRDSPTEEEIAEHYDSLGDFYREVWGDELHHGYWIKGNEPTPIATENLTGALFDLASIAEGDRVCDIGSGYGTTALSLATRQKAQVTGWTLSARQHHVAVASAKELPDGVPRPEFICGDWRKNSTPDSSFDAVIAVESFSHIPDPAGFFRDAARVLKPGGRVALSDWAAPQSTSAWQRRLLLEPICYEGRLAGLVSREELGHFVSDAGFEISTISEIGAEVRKTWRIITGRLLRKTLRDPRYRRFLFENMRSDRKFAVTILRLLAAYSTGSLEYVLLGAVKK